MAKENTHHLTLEEVIEIVQANEHFHKPTILRFPDGKLYSIAAVDAVDIETSAKALAPSKITTAKTKDSVDVATKSLDVINKVNKSVKAFPEYQALLNKGLSEVDADKLVSKALSTVNNMLKN
ncbi:MAG: hypothetical protein QM632_05305 [Micrococcaceae bacterium]